MSIQSNFRAEDMLGTSKPKIEKSAPKYVAPAPVITPVVADPVASIVDEIENTTSTSVEEPLTES